MTNLNSLLRRFFVTIASVAALSTSAFAQTWTGSGGSTDWNLAADWGGTLPGTGNTLSFTTTNASPSATLTNTFASGFSFGGITFNAGTTTAYVMNGNSINLSGGINNSGNALETFSETGGITNSAGSTFTVSSAGGISVTTGLTDVSTGNLTTTVNGSGGTLALGSFTLNSGAAAAVTDTLNGNGNVNITGAVTNGSAFNNGLTYSGSGTLTLSGADTYSGPTTFGGASTVNINSAGALGSGTLVLGNGGTINNTSGLAVTSQTNNPAISIGGVTVIFGGSNNLNLGNGAVTFTNGDTFTLNGTGSTLTLGGMATSATNGNWTSTVNGVGNTLGLGGLVLNSGASAAMVTDSFNGSGNVNITGAVTNGTAFANSLNYNGTGTLTLSGANTYSGLTTVNSGTLALLSTTSTAGGSVVVNGGATLAIGASSTPTSGTVTSGPLGTGFLVMSGGTLIATGGAQTIANNIAVNNDAAGTIGGSQNLTLAGTLILANSGAPNSGAHWSTFVVNNTGLTTFSGGITVNGMKLFFDGSGNILINSAVIDGAGGSGSGFFAYQGTGSETLSAANSYTTTTEVYQGTMIAGTNSAVSTNGAFGNASSAIVLGNATGTTGSTNTVKTGAAAILTDGAFTIGRAITETAAYQNSSLSIGGNQTSGTSTYTGNITLASGNTTTSDILTSAPGGEVDFTTGVIGNGTGTQSIIIGGGGLVKLTGVNTFGGVGNSVTIQGGSTLTTTNAGANMGNANNIVIFNGGIYQYLTSTPFDLSARTLQFNSGGGTIDTNGNAITFANAIGNSNAGGGGLTLADSNGTPGSLTLSAANTYMGTTVTKGTLVTSGSGTLGNTSGALTVNTGGNLNLDGTSQTVGNFGGTGGLVYNNLSGTSTLTIGTGNGGGGSYAGVIENNTNAGAGTVALTKNGTGTIGITGANTYTGATLVSAGTLNLGAGSLGGTAVSLSGGALQFGALNSAATTTIGTAGAGSLTIANSGTLTFANGVANASSTTVNALDINNTTSGATAFTTNDGATNGVINIGVGGSGGSDEIVLGSGLLASLTGQTTVNVNVLANLNGTSQQLISWSGDSGSGTFTLGTVTANGFNAANYSLTLTANGSGLFLNETLLDNAYWKGGTGSSWATLSNFSTNSPGTINRTAALDTTTSVVFVASGNVTAGSYTNTTLDGSGTTTIGTLTYNVGGVSIANGTGTSLTISSAGNAITVGSSLGAETISANVVMGNNQTWTVGSGSSLAVSGNISGGSSLITAGTGTLVLSGSNNTYSGSTTVSAGTLNLQSNGALNGTSSVSVTSGATLQLQNNITTSNTPLTLNGTGTGTAGALENVSGTNTYAGSITLGSNASIGADSGSTLNIGTLGTGATITSASSYGLTLTGAGNGYLYNIIGAGINALIMSGTGTWDIEGSNTYSGTTTINSGILQLGYYDSAPPTSPAGFLGSASNTLTVNTGGTLDLDGWNLTVGNLTGTGGTITNSGALQAGGPYASTLTISGSTNGSYAGSIANGDSGAGVVGLTEQGSGTQTLTGSNSYTGPTTISGGALNIAGSGALSPGTSVTVSSGAALQLSGGFTNGATLLSLTGTGVSSNGALENVSGINTYNGPIALAGATSIGADAGSTLNLSSTAAITGSGNNLTLVGSGNGNLAGAINLGSGTLTLTSSGTWTPSTTNTTGTWTLSGTNTNAETLVTNGTLVYTSASVLAASSSIVLGPSGSPATNTADLTYGGSGETVSNALTFNGTQTNVLGNIGTGAVIYSATPTFGSGNDALVLGNTTDTVGGSIGGIANGSGGITTLTKVGAINSTWILTGSNTYTGVTTVSGGVLQVASGTFGTGGTLTGNLVLSGTSTDPAILQTSGTLTLTTGTNLTWGPDAGFSAIGAPLTLNINGGAALIGFGGSFGGGGGALLTFGSNTSNNQVILPNAINLNTGDTFQQNFYVTKGVGGDSTLLSGVLSNGAGTNAASGFNKVGGGTLILSNGANSYSGYTSVVAGTLVAEASSTVTAANSTATSTGVFGSGFGPNGTGGSAPNPAAFSIIYLGNSQGGSTFGGVINPTLMVGATTVGGSNSISNQVNVNWNNGTNQVYGIGGYTDSNNTFAGEILLNNAAATGNTFVVTQVATTGSDALNITGGITATNGGNINFANIGAVNVTTTGITNGGGAAVSVTQSGPGVTTLAAANTYTGGTTVSGGTLSVTGSTSATGTVAVGGVSGGLSTATLSGTGTIGGAVTTSSANSNVGQIAPGVNTVGTNFGSAGILTVAGALTIGTGTALDVDLSTSSSSGNDQIVMSGGGTLTIGSTLTVNINALGASLQPGTPSTNDYVLISGAGSFIGSPTYTAVLTGAGSAGDTAHVFQNGNNLEVYFTTVGAPASAYYTGTSSTDMNTAANFVATPTGGAVSGPIGLVTDVYIAANSASNLAPTLSTGAVSINSLTLGTGAAASSTVTLSGTNTLTIGGGTGVNTPGIYVVSGAGANTISLPVALGVSQTWSNASGNLLTVSGAVSGAGNLTLAANSTGGITLSGSGVNHTGSITNSGGGSGMTTISAAIGSNVTTVNQTSSSSNLVLTGNNSYTGGTTVTAGTLYVDNTSGSGTGTGGVTVGTGAANTGTLAGNGFIMPWSGATSGVSITSGGSLYSGGTPSGPATSTGASTNGLTLDNTAAHLGNLGTGPSTDSILSVSGDAPANLTFALGAGTNAITVPGGVVGNTSGNTPYDFGNPDTNSTYMTVLGNTAGEINFSGTNTTVTLVDTTNTGALQVGTLALAAPQLQPYLLIAAGADSDYYGLVTEATNGVLSLDQNGWVVGVYNGDYGANPSSAILTAAGSSAYTAINILQENNAMTSVTGYEDLQLYFYDGDLEVVPEPGTWTLMLGGLALLVFIQQRRKSRLS